MAASPAARFTAEVGALLSIPIRDRPIDPFYLEVFGRVGALARQEDVLVQIEDGRGLVAANPIRAGLDGLYAVLDSLRIQVVHTANCDDGEELLQRVLLEWMDDDSGAFAVFTLIPAPFASVPAWALPPSRSRPSATG